METPNRGLGLQKTWVDCLECMRCLVLGAPLRVGHGPPAQVVSRLPQRPLVRISLAYLLYRAATFMGHLTAIRFPLFQGFILVMVIGQETTSRPQTACWKRMCLPRARLQALGDKAMALMEKVLGGKAMELMAKVLGGKAMELMAKALGAKGILRPLQATQLTVQVLGAETGLMVRPLWAWAWLHPQL
mmetsp:Transcript_60796/g.144865  ORF Transcript_60796/g.144865 Transcript_60796/m.144865 type:complete len:188 (+) Transcript_60796:343-906(+)